RVTTKNQAVELQARLPILAVTFLYNLGSVGESRLEMGIEAWFTPRYQDSNNHTHLIVDQPAPQLSAAAALYGKRNKPIRHGDGEGYDNRKNRRHLRFRIPPGSRRLRGKLRAAGRGRRGGGNPD